MTSKIFNFLFKKQGDSEIKDIKPLISTIEYIAPFPKKNTGNNFSRLNYNEETKEEITEVKENFFEGIEGLNVAERELYNL